MPWDDLGTVVRQLYPLVPDGVGPNLRPHQLLHDVEELRVGPESLHRRAELLGLVRQDRRAGKLLVHVDHALEQVLVLRDSITYNYGKESVSIFGKSYLILVLDLARLVERLHDLVHLHLELLDERVEHVGLDEVLHD